MIGLIQYRIDRSFSLLSTRSKFIGLKAFFLNYVMIWILTIPIVGLGRENSFWQFFAYIRICCILCRVSASAELQYEYEYFPQLDLWSVQWFDIHWMIGGIL